MAATLPPGVTIPGAPPPPAPGPVPPGPYAGDKPLAEQAWSNTQAQIAEQRRQLQEGYGVTSEGQVDVVGHPFGYMANLMSQNAATAEGVGAAARHRGLGDSGLAVQGEEAAQGQAQAGISQALQAIFSGNTQLNLNQNQADADLATRKFQDDLNDLLYAQANNKFPTAAPQRSASQVQNMVAQMYKAWQTAYGKNATGAGLNVKNKGGLTFQQRLEALQPTLYDPTATYRVGGQTFGGT